MNNEDKILQSISQLLDQKLEPINQRLDCMDQRLDSLEKEVHTIQSIQLRMEEIHGNKLDALFDGYKANYDLLKQDDPRIARLERAVEKLEFEIRYLKAAK